VFKFVLGQLLEQFAALLACHHCLLVCIILSVVDVENTMMMMIILSLVKTVNIVHKII